MCAAIADMSWPFITAAVASVWECCAPAVVDTTATLINAEKAFEDLFIYDSLTTGYMNDVLGTMKRIPGL